jgi:hypothetical protein
VTHRCHYCGRWSCEAPYVDEEGVGGMPHCTNSDCGDLAYRDAELQRAAMKTHDKKASE